jgi:Family of unknown function (DUF6455)
MVLTTRKALRSRRPQPSKPTVRYHHSAGQRGGEVMTAPVSEYSTHIYEMMTRLGIEPGAGVLPQLSLRYATAVRRCENCRSKMACQDWLDYAPAMVNFAPDFCANADILFDLQYDQAGPRRANCDQSWVKDPCASRYRLKSTCVCVIEACTKDPA